MSRINTKLFSLHTVAAIIAMIVGYLHFNAHALGIIVTLIFSLFLDLDFLIGQHRSWITHSLLPVVFVKLLYPPLAIFALIGVLAHLIVDSIESTVLKGRTFPVGFAEPIHPAFGNELIGWILWIIVNILYFI